MTTHAAVGEMVNTAFKFYGGKGDAGAVVLGGDKTLKTEVFIGKIEGEAKSVTSTLSPLTNSTLVEVVMAKNSLPNNLSIDNLRFASLPPAASHPRFINLTGVRFGRLTVLGYAGRLTWHCQCICGQIRQVAGDRLRSKQSRSCGCLSRELKILRLTTHGESYSAEYKAFHEAKMRCENPRYKCYRLYGGRGIEFNFKSFEEFLAELGHRPSADHSLDRINNDGHYEVGNIKWSTRQEQGRNRRTTVFLTFKDKTMCITDWAKVTGVSRSSMYNRLRNGWCSDCTINLPIAHTNTPRCKHKSFRSKDMRTAQ